MTLPKCICPAFGGRKRGKRDVKVSIPEKKGRGGDITRGRCIWGVGVALAGAKKN